MAREIENLKDDQALLLMYLADELPGAEKEKLNRRLSAEPALLSQLSHLRAAHETFVTAMGFLDRSIAAPVPTDAAVARASRLVRQWTTQRVVRPTAPVIRSRAAGIAWWYYPLAAAAAVIIIVTVSVVHRDRTMLSQSTPADQSTTNPSVPNNSPPNPLGQAQLAVAPADNSSQAVAVDHSPDASAPDAAIAELSADQQDQLLNSLADGTSTDDNDGAIASAPAADDADSVFLGLNGEPDARGGLK